MAAKVWGAGTGAGADGLWSTAANWDGDTVPVTTDTITFNGTAVTDCNIDAVGTWSGGTFTVTAAYSGSITQNVPITCAAFSWSASTIGSTYTQNANFVCTTFFISGAVDPPTLYGFVVSSGNFQCTTFTLNAGLVDFSGVGTCLTTGLISISSTVAPNISTQIIAPPGIWETRGSWDQTGTGADLIDFDANGGTVKFTGGGNITIDVPSITFNLVDIQRAAGAGGSGTTIAAGTTIPLGASPSSNGQALTISGTVTVSGAWSYVNTNTGNGTAEIQVNSGGTISGALTDLTMTRVSLTLLSGSSFPANVALHWLSVGNSSLVTLTATTHTFAVSTVATGFSFTLAAGTTLNLGANPTTQAGNLFLINGTMQVSGTWTHTSASTMQTGAAGVVSGALTTLAMNGSLNLNATSTFPTGVVLALSGTSSQTITATAHTFGASTVSKTSGTLTIATGTTVNWSNSTSHTVDNFTINGTTSIASGGIVTETGPMIIGPAGVFNGPGTIVVQNVSFTMDNTGTTDGTLNVTFNITTSTGRTFTGQSLTYATLTRTGSGSGSLTITGTNTFTSIVDNLGLVAHTIIFPNVTTTVGDFQVAGSAGKLVTLARTGAAGVFTLTKTGGGVIDDVDFISVSNSTVDASPEWYAGDNSTDGGGNTNWIFTDAPQVGRKSFILM